jgi:serine/threonine-protein kinase
MNSPDTVIHTYIDPRIPTQLGRYRIQSELGRGAMGVVYRADDEQLGRPVALKTLYMGEDAAAEHAVRFQQEARAAGGLNHPNLVTVYDVGRDGDWAYLAMELLEGVELRDRLASGRVSLAMAVDIVRQVALGAGVAHARGVVHRDIKPANIMLVHGRHAKLMDFGIARIPTSDVITQTGTILGSPKYMSPEQIAGNEIDHRADIFSLGVVLHEMLTGTTPFNGADVNQLMYAIGHAEPAIPSRLNPEVPVVLDLIVAKTLAKAPADRYQSAEALAADLLACRSGLAGAPDDETDADAPLSAGVSMTSFTPLAQSFATTQSMTRASFAPDMALLSVSRRFDSSAAIERLRGGDLLAPPPPPRKRWRKGPWLLAATLAAALFTSLAIVFG